MDCKKENNGTGKDGSPKKKEQKRSNCLLKHTIVMFEYARSSKCTCNSSFGLNI